MYSGYYYTPTNASVPSSYDASYPPSSLAGRILRLATTLDTMMHISIKASMEINKVCLSHPMMKMVMPSNAVEAPAAGDIDGGFDQSYNQNYAPGRRGNNKLPLKLLTSMSRERSEIMF